MLSGAGTGATAEAAAVSRDGAAAPLSMRQWLLTIGLALLCLPQISPTALNLLDGSWVLASSWAHPLGLRWGEDLAYTYGPLGFLRSPVPFSAGLVLGGFAFWLTASITCIWAALRLQGTGIWSWVVAFVATSLAATVSDIALPVVAVTSAALAVRLRPIRVPAEFAFVLLGAVASLLLLTKFNAGVSTLAISGVLAMVGPRALRCVLGVAVGAIVGLLLLWFVSGGSASGLLPFFEDSVQLALGYSQALANGSRTDGASAVYLAGGVLFVTLIASGWFASRGSLLSVRLGAVGALVLLGASTWLQGFTRFDPGHLSIYFATIGSMSVVLASTAARGRGWVRVAAVGACCVLSAGPLAVTLGSPGGGQPIRIVAPSALIHPIASLTNVHDAAELVVSEPARASRLASLRQQLAAEAGLDPAIADSLTGTRAHAEPQAVGALWAAGATWRPVPVYQTHMAYTPHLDQRNASEVREDSSAERVLREDFGLDGTNPLWQSPRLQVELMCRFREVEGAGRWRILARSEDRCGPAADIGRVDVGEGVPVQVPLYDGLVTAGIALSGDSDGRLEVTCDATTFPLMQGLPTESLLMRIPESAGWTQQANPQSCTQVSFSAPVTVTWSGIPLLAP